MESNAKHFLAGKRVLVAGAGIAGLSFVTALHKLWDPSQERPTIVLCDRDAGESTIEREGYSLSLNGTDSDTGLYALMELGLLDEILNHAVLRADKAGSFVIWTSTFKPVLSFKPTACQKLPTSNIRIARKNLRRILLDAACQTVKLRWSTSCISADRLDDGRIRVRVADHVKNCETLEEFDLVVAADGASSKIRGYLRPADNLDFAGAVQMGGNARFDSSPPTPVNTNFGLVMTGDGSGCFVSPVDNQTVVWALSRREESPRPRFDSTDAKQVQEMLNEAQVLGKSISEPFSTLLNATDWSTTFVLNARDKKPFQHGEKMGSVVFIGDCNHAVSPFAGNGANLALKDGWDLAENLCKFSLLQDAIQAYDRISEPRALATLKTSRDRIAMIHSVGLWFWLYRVVFTIMGWVLRIFGQ